MFFNRQKITFYVLTVLFIAAVLVWVAVFQSGLVHRSLGEGGLVHRSLGEGGQLASISGNLGEREELKVIFFDVGQGAAVFIEAPNGNQMLVDGGPGSQILNKLGKAMPFFDREIDLVVLTHPDSDHINGLIDVLKKYEVGQVVDPCLADPSGGYQEWLRLVEEKEILRLCARVGQRIKLADGIVINVLYPFQSLESISFTNTNDASIVLKIVYGESAILLTGDAEKKTEYQLVHSDINLQSQVFQVGHHGSKTSTTEEFVTAVQPEIAVIQVGKNNRYGHPHQEVLDRLAGIKIFRTDLDEDVNFLCSPESCKGEQ